MSTDTFFSRAYTDTIKGFAITGIFLCHYFEKVYGSQSLIQWTFAPNAIRDFFYAVNISKVDPATLFFLYFGYVGVSMFFVLSGYGLASSRLGNEPQLWKAFFIRRCVRLMPLYYLSIAVFSPIVALSAGLPTDKVWNAVISKVLFIHTFNINTMFYINSSLWFVGVIVWLYACFPLIFSFARKNASLTFLICFAVSYLSSAWIASSDLARVHSAFAMGGFPLSRLGEFSFGICFAVVVRAQPRKAEAALRHPLLIMCSAIMFSAGVGGLIYRPLYPCHQLFLSVPLMHVITLSYRVMGKGAATLFYPFSFAGRHSYALFVIHEPLLLLSTSLMKSSSLSFIAVAGIVLPLFAVFSAGVGLTVDRLMRSRTFASQ